MKVSKFGLGKSMSFQNFYRKVSELSRFGIRKLFHENNIYHHTFHICIEHITFTHITYHIAYNTFCMQHITFLISFIHMPWDLGIMDLTLRHPRNEGSTDGTSTRESSLANTQSVVFIHMYIISFYSWATVKTSYTQDLF